MPTATNWAMGHLGTEALRLAQDIGTVHRACFRKLVVGTASNGTSLQSQLPTAGAAGACMPASTARCTVHWLHPDAAAAAIGTAYCSSCIGTASDQINVTAARATDTGPTWMSAGTENSVSACYSSAELVTNVAMACGRAPRPRNWTDVGYTTLQA